MGCRERGNKVEAFYPDRHLTSAPSPKHCCQLRKRRRHLCRPPTRHQVRPRSTLRQQENRCGAMRSKRRRCAVPPPIDGAGSEKQLRQQYIGPAWNRRRHPPYQKSAPPGPLEPRRDGATARWWQDGGGTVAGTLWDGGDTLIKILAKPLPL